MTGAAADSSQRAVEGRHADGDHSRFLACLDRRSSADFKKQILYKFKVKQCWSGIAFFFQEASSALGGRVKQGVALGMTPTPMYVARISLLLTTHPVK